MPGRPSGPGIPMAGAVRKGTPKIVPIVVSAGLAVGVFCGLYFGLGTGEPQEAEANTTAAKTTGPTGPQSAAAGSSDQVNFKSGEVPPSQLNAGSGSEAGSGATPGSATTPPPGTGSGTTPPPGTGSGTTPPPGTGSGTTPPPDTGEVSVALTFTITPADAELTLDGDPVAGGKATITFTGDKKTVRIVAKAKGHKSYDKKITVTRDTAEEQIEITLPKKSGGSRPPRDRDNGGRDRDPPGGLIDL